MKYSQTDVIGSRKLCLLSTGLALFGSLMGRGDAASVVVVWNSVVAGEGEFAHGTYTTPYGFATPAIDDLSSSAIRSTGITLFRHEGSFDHLYFQNVPAELSLDHFIEFDVTPKAGVEFDPSSVRMVLFRPNQDANASYQVRSSADGFSSVIDTADWNGSKNGYNYLEADLSSLGEFDTSTTFRLYLSDGTGDGQIQPVGSIATWPYGIQLFGETAESVPESSSSVFLGLGCLCLISRRRKS